MFGLFKNKKADEKAAVNSDATEKDMNEMNDYYEITIAGCKRQLKKFAVNDKLDIAAFILFGDVEVTEKSAEALLAKLPDFDLILTPEAKSIPLAYEMSRQSGKKNPLNKRKRILPNAHGVVRNNLFYLVHIITSLIILLFFAVFNCNRGKER